MRLKEKILDELLVYYQNGHASTLGEFIAARQLEVSIDIRDELGRIANNILVDKSKFDKE